MVIPSDELLVDDQPSLQEQASRARRRGRAAVKKNTSRLERLAVEYVPVASVYPNRYNPNRQDDHDFELLVRSMLEDGFTQPILVQAESREIIDGEHRWTAAIVLDELLRRGLDPLPDAIAEIRDQREQLLEGSALQVPVVFTTMSPEQMRVATLRHNRARGSEDVEMTAALLRDLQQLGALDHAQDSLMLDDEAIALLIENVAAPESLAGEEFGEAWEPSDASFEADALEDDGLGSPIGEREISSTNDGGARASATTAAATTMRAREAAIQQARDESERQQARVDHAIYRISLIFSDEEAVLVKRVLGDRPAAALLDLCRAAAAPRGGVADEFPGPRA